MNIVGNSYFLKNLRNLDFFELDLGKSKKEVNKDVFRKLDAFVIQYKNLYNNIINKFGKIGNKVFFYEDLRLTHNKFIVFNNDDIYEIKFEDKDLLDMKGYLLNVLMEIEGYNIDENVNVEIDKYNSKMVNDKSGSDFWVAKDEKNNGKKYIIDQSLSREDYRNEIEKRFFNK